MTMWDGVIFDYLEKYHNSGKGKETEESVSMESKAVV